MLRLALMVPEACRVLLHCRATGKYGSRGVRSTPAELRLTVSDGTGSASAMSQKIGAARKAFRAKAAARPVKMRRVVSMTGRVDVF